MADQISNFRRKPEVLRRDSLKDICPEHGHFVNAKTEQFDGSYKTEGCSKCYWAALNTDLAGSESNRAARTRKGDERLNTLLIGSGITPRFRDRTLGSYKVDGHAGKAKALQVCQTYVDQFEENYRIGRSLILTGNPGTGKTHLASGMVQEVIRKYGATGLIVSVAEIVRVSKGTMNKGAGYSERDVINELAHVDLLVLDEIGAQAGTAYELAVLHEVIDRRYQLVLPTVAISNLAVDNLKAYIGERALDRLRENGGQAVGFTWSSARGDV